VGTFAVQLQDYGQMEAECDFRGEHQDRSAHRKKRPHQLVNWGINRWAFKPELGYFQRWGHTECWQHLFLLLSRALSHSNAQIGEIGFGIRTIPKRDLPVGVAQFQIVDD
jgi:hypothetical protein